MRPQGLLNFELPPLRPRIARPRTLKTRECLFHQGEPANALFVVTAGRIILTRYTLEGAAITLQVVREGGLVGTEAAHIGQYACTAICEGETTVNAWPLPEFRNTLALCPEFALQFAQHLMDSISSLNNSLELRGIRSARSRILRYLRFVIPQQQDSICFDRPFKDIASELGLTPEVFYRTLSALEREGVIERQPRQIRLLRQDIDGLTLP